MDEYIDVKIDVFDHLGQRARLRKSLTIRTLIEEILKEFDDIGADAPEKYVIYAKGIDRPLPANATLTQLDIQHQDELIFKGIRQDGRQNLKPHQYASLQDESGTIYRIEWQPAIIGRPNNDSQHDMNLAVNLQFHPNRQSISRSHAQITFSNGRYYLESLSERNPVFVGEKKVVFTVRHELKNGAKISIGPIGLQMTFRTQAASVENFSSNPVEIVSLPENNIKQNLQAVSNDTQPTPGTAKKAFLIIENANDETKIGHKIEFIQYPSMVGRKVSALEMERGVSRQHAVIDYNPANDRFSIKDLISANGVFINGTRLTPNQDYEIQPGTRIRLGPKLILRFEV